MGLKITLFKVMSAPTQARPSENFQPVISAICVLYYTHKRRLGCIMEINSGWIYCAWQRNLRKRNIENIWESLLVHKSSKSLDSLTKTSPLPKNECGGWRALDFRHRSSRIQTTMYRFLVFGFCAQPLA